MTGRLSHNSKIARRRRERWALPVDPLIMHREPFCDSERAPHSNLGETASKILEGESWSREPEFSVLDLLLRGMGDFSSAG